MRYTLSCRRALLAGLVLLTLAGPGATEEALEGAAADTRLDEVLAGAQRSEANRDRDRFRRPGKTLLFFGLRPDMTVLEILPGRGWYTEILAPLLRGQGQLTIASYGAGHSNDYLRGLHNQLMEKMDGAPAVYDRVQRQLFRRPGAVLPDVADASQDMVLTFRNTHNWIRFGGIEAIYRNFHRVLKPGGILGVVQHRAAPGSDAGQSAEQGYVPEKWLIRLVEDIGFELLARSEINANPGDHRDHPEGVWTLPPSLRLGGKDRDRYLAIGESDRMTLKFMKLP